jgi:recombination protein RecA
MALALPLPSTRAPRGKHTQLALPGVAVVTEATSGTAVAAANKPLAWQGQALAGRIIELSGSTGRTSTAVSMLLAAQREGEAVVWIEPTDGALYPPDLAAAGVDLDALVIVRVPTKEGPEGLCRVAEWLVRSGGFGLLVMDLMGRAPAAQSPWQTRLSGLLRKHDAQLCVLSDSQAAAPSLGAMVALRLEPQRQRDEDGSFVLSHRILKNKLGVAHGPAPERRRAPAGLEVLPTFGTVPVAQLSLFDDGVDVASLPLFAPVTALPVAPPVVVRTSLAAKRVSLRPGSAGSVESGGRAESASSASRTGSDGSTESASSEGQP